MLLVVIRLTWILVERGKRPPSLSRAAGLGHLVLYVLMVAVPMVALIRQYGSGNAFAPFGIPLMPGFEGEIEWMTGLGSNFHSLLGWTLLALIAGHVVMVIWHRQAKGQDVLARMAPRFGESR
jgi:cytochrome b561